MLRYLKVYCPSWHPKSWEYCVSTSFACPKQNNPKKFDDACLWLGFQPAGQVRALHILTFNFFLSITYWLLMPKQPKWWAILVWECSCVTWAQQITKWPFPAARHPFNNHTCILFPQAYVHVLLINWPFAIAYLHFGPGSILYSNCQEIAFSKLYLDHELLFALV